MEKIIIGCDPGSKGFLVAVRPDGIMDFCSIQGTRIADLNKWLGRQITTAADYEWNIIAVVEEIHAIFGSSAKATFSFGEVFGLIKGLIYGNMIPLHLVPPKVWQKEIWVNSDMVYEYKKREDGTTRKAVDTKKTSMNAAARLFPHVDFKKNARCKNINDNKVDCALIAEYARRKNL